MSKPCEPCAFGRESSHSIEDGEDARIRGMSRDVHLTIRPLARVSVLGHSTPSRTLSPGSLGKDSMLPAQKSFNPLLINTS